VVGQSVLVFQASKLLSETKQFLPRESGMPVSTTDIRRNPMNPLKSALFFLLLCATILFFSGGCATTGARDMEPIDVSLLENWSGDSPVSGLGRLPAGQQETMTGYIGDTKTFIPIWQVFKPNDILPTVDFSKHIIVFSRNVQFYNRTSILKVML